MDLRRTSTALTLEQKLAVVSVADIKAQVRELSNEEDALIRFMIGAAYDHLAGPNGWLGNCSLLNETWEWYTSGPGEHGFELPMRPVHVLSPVTLESIAADGTYSAVDSGVYYLPSNEGFSLLGKLPSKRWPYTGAKHPRAYRVTFTAGFGTAADIPMPIKMGIRMLAAHWYRNRETVGSEGRTVGQEIEYGLKALCGRYRYALDHA